MANPNVPFGFMELRADGKENRVEYFKKETGTAIYQFDPVERNANGTVELAEEADVVLGIAAESKAATYTGDIAVITDPDAEFIVQADADFQQTDIHLNVDFNPGTPDTALSRSGSSLKMSTKGTGATLPFRMLGLYARGVNAFGSYAIVRVRMNDVVRKAGVAGL
jgi:hypothetical protein